MLPFQPKRFALDFDDTFTLDTEMWSLIVAMMLNRGYDVRFVTFRYMMDRNEDIEYWAEHLSIPVIYCEGVQKAQVCASQGWSPDVWIDDMPILIPMKQQLQGMIIGIDKNGG